MNIKDEAVELKPCPFCASRVLNQFKDDDYHIIQCAQCGCEIRHTQHHKVSSCWNRRALEAALPHLSQGGVTDGMVDRAWRVLHGDDSKQRVRLALSAALASHEPVRTCTCHPDDSPPTPCAEKYALGDCELAATTDTQEVETLREGIKEIAEREQSIRDNWTRFEAETGARILELETDLEIATDKVERLRGERDDNLRQAEEQWAGWVKEQAAHKDTKARIAELKKVLEDVKQRCLVGDDDGISVSEDVVIESELFSRICAALGGQSNE